MRLAVEQLVLTRQGTKMGNVQGAIITIGASFGSFQVLFLLVTQVPIQIFLTIFLPSFWL